MHVLVETRFCRVAGPLGHRYLIFGLKFEGREKAAYLNIFPYVAIQGTFVIVSRMNGGGQVARETGECPLDARTLGRGYETVDPTRTLEPPHPSAPKTLSFRQDGYVTRMDMNCLLKISRDRRCAPFLLLFLSTMA